VDEEWFDRLSRRLAAPISRRQAFQAVMAAALGGALLELGVGEAYASAA